MGPTVGDFLEDGKIFGKEGFMDIYSWMCWTGSWDQRLGSVGYVTPIHPPFISIGEMILTIDPTVTFWDILVRGPSPLNATFVFFPKN